MNDKIDLLKDLLKDISKEDLAGLFEEAKKEKEEEETIHSISKNDSSSKPNNRRRGKGTRKKNKRTSQAKKTSKSKACHRTQIEIKKRENKFDDFFNNTVLSSSERKELEQATEADKKTVVNKTPRTRGSTLVDIRCRSCGQDHTVSSSLVYDESRWKCNNCCTTPG
tara:strand:+ start:9353 stop:9853 length:501 start_codon:yes stop_codon:yes gene_type:complete